MSARRPPWTLVLLWTTGGGAVALFAGIAIWLAPLTPGALTLQLAFSPRAFGQIVHWWPPEHLARYRAHFAADFVLLACYGAFGWLLASRTRLFARGSAALRGWTAWALPLAALCNAVQDILHLWLTAAPRFGVPWVYPLAALAACAKWVLLAAWAGSAARALLKADD